MDYKLLQEIRIKMDLLHTKELNRIFEEHDRSKYSEETFEAIRQILLERGAQYIPPIKEDYTTDEYVNIIKVPNKKSIYISRIIGFIIIIIVGLAVYFLFIAPKNSNTALIPLLTKQASKQIDLQVINWTMTQDEYSRCIIGTVKNNSDKKFSFIQVEFILYDDSGAQIGSTFADVENLKPNSSLEFKVLIDDASATRAKFKDVSGW